MNAKLRDVAETYFAQGVLCERDLIYERLEEFAAFHNSSHPDSDFEVYHALVNYILPLLKDRDENLSGELK